MPDLEFIADMNISPLTVDELRKKGWDIVRVSEIMSVKTKDIDILNICEEKQQGFNFARSRFFDVVSGRWISKAKCNKSSS